MSEKIIVGVFLHRNWPVYRLKEMDSLDKSEIERYRRMFEASPMLLEVCKTACRDCDYEYDSLCNTCKECYLEAAIKAAEE